MRARPVLRPARSRRRAGSGFTLIEVTLATVLMGLIFAGTIDLFLTATKMTGKVNAMTASSQDSANAVQRIIEKTREAQAVYLPDDSGFVPLTSYSNVSTYYKNTASGSTIDTALEVSLPAAQTPNVLGTGGASIPVSAYDRTGASGYVLYYRGNADGSPNPSSGQYLCEYWSTLNVIKIRCKTLDTLAWNAVQFVQPVGSPNEIEIKIICASYDIINGQATNEETDGSHTSTLTGKCVLMRDAGTNNSPSADATSITHPFQHS